MAGPEGLEPSTYGFGGREESSAHFYEFLKISCWTRIWDLSPSTGFWQFLPVSKQFLEAITLLLH